MASRKPKRFEYVEVDRVSVKQLDEYGAHGWMPAALRYEEQERRIVGDTLDSGYSGLLYREIPD